MSSFQFQVISFLIFHSAFFSHVETTLRATFRKDRQISIENITSRYQALDMCFGHCFFKHKLSAAPLKTNCGTFQWGLKTERNCSDVDPFPDIFLLNAILCIPGPATALRIYPVYQEDSGYDLDVSPLNQIKTQIEFSKSSIRDSISRCPILDGYLYIGGSQYSRGLYLENNKLLFGPDEKNTIDYIITLQILSVKDFSSDLMLPPYSRWAALATICRDPECAEEAIVTPGRAGDLLPLMPIIIYNHPDLGPVIEGDPIDKIFPLCR